MPSKHSDDRTPALRVWSREEDLHHPPSAYEAATLLSELSRNRCALLSWSAYARGHTLPVASTRCPSLFAYLRARVDAPVRAGSSAVGLEPTTPHAPLAHVCNRKPVALFIEELGVAFYHLNYFGRATHPEIESGFAATAIRPPLQRCVSVISRSSSARRAHRSLRSVRADGLPRGGPGGLGGGGVGHTRRVCTSTLQCVRLVSRQCGSSN